mmetsp:Transcript_8677/g.7622  ORF Transcript_8677/g.7622 Transcript_8677/m.7622 type:complete len:130 (+) Transcript_8677:1662-2051(+)
MIEIPNFSEELKNTLVPCLEKAKDYLKKSLKLLRDECLLFENNIQAEEAFILMSQVCMYLREYRPRHNFKYYKAKDIEKYCQEKGESQIDNFDKHLDDLAKEDLNKCYYLEWEAFCYLNYALQVSEAKQ